MQRRCAGTTYLEAPAMPVRPKPGAAAIEAAIRAPRAIRGKSREDFRFPACYIVAHDERAPRAPDRSRVPEPASPMLRGKYPQR